MSAKKITSTVQFDTDTAFAAACAAQRVNKRYIKAGEVFNYNDEDSEARKNDIPSKALMYKFLDGSLEVKDCDREEAQKVRCHYQGLTFKLLSNDKLSDFDHRALRIADGAVVSGGYDLAMLASLPSCYQRNLARNSAKVRLAGASGFIGAPGDKIVLDIEILKSVFSENYQVYFLTGITAENKSVFFSYRNTMTVGSRIKVSGTIKAHRDNITQLTRTKVI